MPPDCDDAALERLLFPPSEPSSVQRPAPSWPTVHIELRPKGVTLELLWQEYKAAQPDGYYYSAFCEHYRRCRQQLTTSWGKPTRQADACPSIALARPLA